MTTVAPYGVCPQCLAGEHGDCVDSHTPGAHVCACRQCHPDLDAPEPE